MEYLLIALVLGFIVGYKDLAPRFFSRTLNHIINLSLITILISLGADIGSTPEVINNINKLGLQSVVLGGCATAGSVFTVYFLEKINYIKDYSEYDHEIFGNDEEKYSIWPVVISLTAGIILGLFILPDNVLKFSSYIVMIALYIMVFGVGTDLGANKKIWQELKTYGLKIFLLPFSVMGGALAGGIIAAFFAGIPLNVGMAVAAGCGFYSATGPILSEVATVKLGTIGFLANLFREIITFLVVPLIARKFGKFSAIASGGATTMDTSLPVIMKCVGRNFALVAIVSGMVLSALVPVMVPFLAKISF